MQASSTVATAPPVEPDPQVVTPGAMGLMITLVLFLAVILLVRSMRRHLHRIDLPRHPDDERGRTAADDHRGDDAQYRNP